MLQKARVFILLSFVFAFEANILAQRNTADSLKSIANKTDTLTQGLSKTLSKSDSIGEKIQNISDSSGKFADSLKRVDAKARAIQQHTKNKVDSLQQKVSSPVAKLEEKIGQKSNAAEKLTGKSVAADTEIPSLEKSESSIPKLDASGVAEKLNADIPGTDLKLPSVDEGVPDINLQRTGDLDKVNGLKEEVSGVDGKLAGVDQYEGDLQKIKEGAPENLEKLPEVAEQKLTDIPEAGAASEEITKATAEQAKYEAMIQRYRDRKLLQDEISRKYKAVANDYVMQQADKVQLAQKQLELSKYKATRIKSIKDIFRKQSDELEEKKFYQRLVPGLMWQLYTKDFVSADVSLQVGYRVTPHLTAGIGGIYRLGFNKHFDYFVKGLQTFGGRAYTDLTISKGLFAHGEFEVLKLHPSITTNTREPLSKHVYESYFGLGKRFNITRNIRGNVLGLYRVEYSGKLPAASKVSARFGVEYVFRRPKKKLDGL